MCPGLLLHETGIDLMGGQEEWGEQCSLGIAGVCQVTDVVREAGIGYGAEQPESHSATTLSAIGPGPPTNTHTHLERQEHRGVEGVFFSGRGPLFLVLSLRP